MQLLILVAAGLLCALDPALAETVYITNEQDNAVSVIDGGTLELVDNVLVGTRPRVAQVSGGQQADLGFVRATGNG